MPSNKQIKTRLNCYYFNPRRLTKILCSGNNPGLSYKNWFLFWVLLLDKDVFLREKCRRKEGKVSGQQTQMNHKGPHYALTKMGNYLSISLY